MEAQAITDREFGRFQELMRRCAGVHLAPAKKALVSGRLAKRLRRFRLERFDEYYDLLESGAAPGELDVALDLLTTHETYFFREPKHFEFVRDRVLRGWPGGRMFRAWSAACSTGEEAYTTAMIAAECLGEGPWEVLGTDVSAHAVEKARAARYTLERARPIPAHYLARFCLQGVRSMEGWFTLDPALRRRVAFRAANLCAPPPNLGTFDAILLRNVLIYFDLEIKRRVVAEAIERLKPGGYLMVGHSETLNGVADGLRPVQPSVYRKP